MKKLFLSAALIFTVTGCSTTHDYFSLQPTPMQPSTWTGQYDQLVATVKINSDGTGVICQDVTGKAKLMSVKRVGDRLYSQDGTYWKIQNETPSSMRLNYAIGGGYSMQKDNDMKLITPACVKELKQ